MPKRDIPCLPKTFKKDDSKDARDLRDIIINFIVFHVVAFFVCAVFVSVWFSLKQILYIYLGYLMYMTLSIFSGFLYLALVSIGTVLDLLETWNLRSGLMGFLIFALILFVQGVEVYILSQNMTHYFKHQKKEDSKEQLIEQDDDDESKDDDNDEEQKVDRRGTDDLIRNKILTLPPEKQEELKRKLIAKYLIIKKEINQK